MSLVSCGNGKFCQWLIDQIDSGKYLGLVWENEEKSIFCIFWKYVGKQDYNCEEDVVFFKVIILWVVYGWDGGGFWRVWFVLVCWVVFRGKGFDCIGCRLLGVLGGYWFKLWEKD